AADMLFYDLEGTWQYGKQAGADVNGLSLDTILGVNLMDRHSVAFSFAYANDEYQNLFGNAHDYLGATDLIGRNNLMAMGLSAKLGLTDSISAGVAGHYFMKAKTSSGHTTRDAAVAASSKRALGMEADLMLSYRAEEALTFDFGYAFFKPAGSLKDAGADKVMSDIYVQGTLKF
ncbi:MAG: alginate export family protein, partial [Bdellovibrionota bacterium]